MASGAGRIRIRFQNFLDGGRLEPVPSPSSESLRHVIVDPLRGALRQGHRRRAGTTCRACRRPTGVVGQRVRCVVTEPRRSANRVDGTSREILTPLSAMRVALKSSLHVTVCERSGEVLTPAHIGGKECARKLDTRTFWARSVSLFGRSHPRGVVHESWADAKQRCGNRASERRGLTDIPKGR